MVLNEFYVKLYNIIPLHRACDISHEAIRTALIQLNFKLEACVVYHLYLSRSDLLNVQTIVNSPLQIAVHLAENLPNGSWYLVDHNIKTVIYSPGA